MPQLSSKSEGQRPTGASSQRGVQGKRSTAERILIVEDDYFVAIELEHQLREAGYEVVGVASTAEQAIEIGAAESPALAIMDVRLAGSRDGIDAAIELSSKFGIRSIFATAHGDSETRRRAQQANPLGWLTKPYSASALLASVKAALEGHI
jgi:DNA-binding NarL/FixJ family response regulator